MPNTRVNQQLKIVIAILGVITLLEIINLLTGRTLNHYGNLPRVFDALPGLLIGPLLHGSPGHYLSNLLPLGVFSFLMLQHGVKRFAWVTLWIMLFSGALVWLFARPAIHVGASGVIYGYFGYLVLAGLLSGRVKLLVIALLVGFFYGGLIFGVLPGAPYISWESHLFGFIAGLIAAVFTNRAKR